MPGGGAMPGGSIGMPGGGGGGIPGGNDMTIPVGVGRGLGESKFRLRKASHVAWD